jgi:mono/diheme cytochrome c family protein
MGDRDLPSPYRETDLPMRTSTLTPALLALTVLGSLAAFPVRAATPAAAQIYHDYCSVCHGDQGDGQSRASGSMNPPPRDFTSAQASANLDRARMLDAVLNGRPGTAMTAWRHQLSEAEAAAVVDFIREKFMLPATTASDNEGRRLYAEYCSVCHGDQGNGVSRASGSLNPPPRDFTSAAARSELDRERMLFAVKHGRPNTAMPGWSEQLDDSQVAAVVDYVRSAFMHLEAGAGATADSDAAQGHHDDATTGPGGGHVHQQAEADLNAPFADGLVGDRDWGEAFYNANCAICHGETGDGRGPRAYFIMPKPRDFGHAAARASLNRPHLYETIAHGKVGTEMPGWRHVIGPQEMANVAEYVFQEFILADASEVETQPSAAEAHDHAPGAAPHGH